MELIDNSLMMSTNPIADKQIEDYTLSDLTKMFNFVTPNSDFISELLIFKHMKNISCDENTILLPAHPANMLLPGIYNLDTPDGLEKKLLEIYPDRNIPFDCSLFAQFYCQTMGKNGMHKKSYIFCFPPINIFFNLIDGGTDTLYYIVPKNKECEDQLKQSSCNSKGQFVIKISENKFIGLTSSGIFRKSLQDWRTMLFNECEKWSYNRKDMLMSEDNLLKKIIYCKIKLNKLDDWIAISENNRIDINM